MDFSYYPFDGQSCLMTIETFAYRTDELRLKWRKTCELNKSLLKIDFLLSWVIFLILTSLGMGGRTSPPPDFQNSSKNYFTSIPID